MGAKISLNISTRSYYPSNDGEMIWQMGLMLIYTPIITRAELFGCATSTYVNPKQSLLHIWTFNGCQYINIHLISQHLTHSIPWLRWCCY